jgi:glutamate 5-kinase
VDQELTQRDWVGRVRRVVVKIGSGVLVDQDNRLDESRVATLVDQMAAIRHAGGDIVCVSSGAVAAGVADLGLDSRPDDLPSLQAAAAIGQARLVDLYRRLFHGHGLAIGQVLLTHGDLQTRDRHLNARNTFSRLLRCGAVPIVNENDTVAVEEIRFGDNDKLSALVAMLLRADALIMLTTVDGLLTSTESGNGRLVPTVKEITPEIRALAGGSTSGIAVGGMQTKIEAADMVTRSGEHCVVADGRRPGVLTAIMDGEAIGTVFEPAPERMADRKRWIAFFDHPRGELQVDAGASRALRQEGRSLLPIGMTAVSGTFERGAPVRIVDDAGREIGRGLVNYAAHELGRIVGLRSEEIADVLGVCEYEEVVHRDNLVLA